jgi:Ca2+-transporting ATPase
MLPPPTLTPPQEALPPQASLSRHARAAHRLRLSVPGLLGDPLLARHLEETLSHYPGVRSARASTRSGRLLIIYDEAPALLAALPQQPAPRAVRRARPDARGAEVARGGEIPELPPFHALPLDEVLRLLQTSPEGLDPAEVARRQAQVGLNLPEPEEARSHLQILAAQLKGIPTGILLGASALSLALGDLTEAAAILAVVTLNTAIGYRIERKNEDLLASWRKMEAGEVQVLRGGDLQAVPSFDLVPGDVLLCRGGDMVPADARVIDAHRLSCDEAPLTGESEPAHKAPAPVAREAPLAERGCMLYAGTAIASGHCRAVVTATGPRTELAQVQRLLLRERAPRAPLEVRLNQLGNRAAALGIAASVAAGAAGLLRRRPAAQVLRTAVALGVAALPEGLPVVATAALVRCMHRMRERHMVVRRLAAAETLGGVTVICADKTGTLTKNEMRLQVLDLGQRPLDPAAVRARPREPLSHPPTLALAAAVLNSDVDVHMNGKGLSVSGSATERALVTAAHQAGLDSMALRAAFPRLLLRERSEGVNYVVSLHRQARGPLLAFVKGAPDQVLALCDRDLRGPLGEEARRRLLRRNDEMAE